MHINTTLRAIAMALLVTLAWPTWAGGEHGQNAVPETAKAWPSVTAVSETFELVGRLEHDQLTVLVDQAASNAPVLDATLHIVLAGRTGLMPFNAGRGDYVLRDAEMLDALQQPGHQQLIFTLASAGLSEQLRGELEVDSDTTHTAGALPGAKRMAMWFGLVVAVLLLLVMLARRFTARRKHAAGGAR